MTEKPGASTADQETLRRASLRITVWISSACAVLVLCLLAGAAIYLLNKTGPPVRDPSDTDAAYAYLDAKDLLKAMIIAGGAGIIIAAVIGWLSARRAIRPLGEALALQRRFVQDASHQMRTPLAILDARIQLAQRHSEPGSPTGQALSRIRDDTAVVTAIVNDLLEAAAGTAQRPGDQPCDVDAAAARLVEDLRPVADQRRITLEHSGSGRPTVSIDPNSLRRALLALTENALTHTPPEGAVAVTTAAEGNQAVISVKDTGPGITGINPDFIFDRFARAEPAVASECQRSFGIGLSLTREIISRAGGTVEVAATGPQGTVMRIVLPLARD
ncbi:HAMP domain-containing sensor histidine kinase [Paenarthrobacter nicotinovorans]|uniref:histidine kinase n=1 Tax=Paenarthrobacter nicotinovorans TaxID=29320 RepID=A0ABV0GMI1_PAENI